MKSSVAIERGNHPGLSVHARRLCGLPRFRMLARQLSAVFNIGKEEGNCAGRPGGHNASL